MARSVKMNYKGVGEVLNSAGVRADLTARAERVLSAAQSSAPVVSGGYRDGLELMQDTTDRAVVRVVATAPYGYVVEANTGNLARALDAGR
jgi:hypothetical protein